MPALATINVLNGTLNGAGDTRWPWMITMSGYLLVRIPLTYVLTTPTAQLSFTHIFSRALTHVNLGSIL